MKTHVDNKGLSVDISAVLNDIRTAADLGNLDRSHWAGKRRDGGCGVKRDQGVYVQIENLPYLGLTQGHHQNYKTNEVATCVYIKRAVIRRNLHSLGISLVAAGPSVHQILWYQNYFRQGREAHALI